MKYAVGDKVRIRSWESLEREFGLSNTKDIMIPSMFFVFDKAMKSHCGEFMTVKSVHNTAYKMEEDNGCWDWTDEMLEPVECIEFDWDAFQDEDSKIVVYCKTEEEAGDFCRQMHERGMTWSNGESYLENNNFVKYIKIVYYSSGNYGSLERAQNNGYKILEWSDYMKTEKKEFTLDDLENEMIVELQNGNFYLVLGEKLIGKNGFMRKADYNSNSTFSQSDGINRKWDIIAVYPPSKTYSNGLMNMLQPDAAPIWKRQNKIVIPETCKNILRCLDKKYNWIAKDNDKQVYVYTKEPVKHIDSWSAPEWHRIDDLFSTLDFSWLSWEDEEPVNFREVLKGE